MAATPGEPEPFGLLDRDDGEEARLAERTRNLPRGVPSILLLLAAALVMLAVWVGVGTLLTKVASHDELGEVDRSISLDLFHHRTKTLNNVTHDITNMAQERTVEIIAVLVVIVSAIRWRRWREPMLVVAAIAGEVTVFVSITALVGRPRPFVTDPTIRPLDAAPPTSSFPSGHTAASTALYGVIALLLSEQFRAAVWRGLVWAIAILIPVAVAFCRLYRGMHYLTDVLGGALLGATWLFVATRAIRLGVLHSRLQGLGKGRSPAPSTQ